MSKVISFKILNLVLHNTKTLIIFIFQILLPHDDWETSTRPGGWIPSKSSTYKLKFLNIINIKKHEIIEYLLYLKYESRCPYINKIEINTLIFRYLWKLHRNFDEMYRYIMVAIAEIVITPEVILFLILNFLHRYQPN